MAKKKHLIRNSMKSFFETHTDPEKHEKLKATRKDMEEKKKQILNFVENEEQKDESKKGPLAELVEDFHKQYESLYDHYDHLTGELKNKVHKHHHENGNSSSSSDSDSDSGSDSDHSPKKKGIRNGNLEEQISKADGLQQELEAAKVEVTLLKNNLEAVYNEKETLKSAYDTLISKLESSEKTVQDLKVEAEALNSEKSNLLAEKEELNFKLEGSAKTEVNLKQQIEELIREKDNLAIEKENADKAGTSDQIKALEEQNSSLKFELDTVMRERREIEERFESKVTEMGKMAEEISVSKARISEVENLLKEREDEISSLQNKLEVNDNESNSKIEALTAKVDDFTQEVDRLHAEKSQLEGQLQESRADLEEARSQIEKLTKDMSATAETKDNSVAKLERTIEVLKREVEMAEDEAHTSLEKTRNIEFQLLMLKQKLRVTEQLLAEKEEDFKLAEKKYREESKILEDRVNRLSVVIAAKKKAYRGMILNISEKLNSSVAAMESTTKKLEEDNDNFSSRINSLSEEIQTLQQCMSGKNIERTRLEEQLKSLTEELQNEREHGLIVKQNLSDLEVETEKHKVEKEKLTEALNELKKTAEKQVTILEDEKLEAIRQLCLWSDNLQSRCNEFRSMVIKSSKQIR